MVQAARRPLTFSLPAPPLGEGETRSGGLLLAPMAEQGSGGTDADCRGGRCFECGPLSPSLPSLLSGFRFFRYDMSVLELCRRFRRLDLGRLSSQTNCLTLKSLP